MKYAVRLVTLNETELFLSHHAYPNLGLGSSHSYNWHESIFDATLYGEEEKAFDMRRDAGATKFSKVVCVDGTVISVVPEPCSEHWAKCKWYQDRK